MRSEANVASDKALALSMFLTPRLQMAGWDGMTVEQVKMIAA
uniref:Uncharacterized protein n=1 Tax=Arundo donax TaxID=35708 RepID=A0A0A8XYN9_ARUDO